MEAVIFALIGTRNETFVPESSEFQTIDLRVLRDSYNAVADCLIRRSRFVAHAS
jgi:hypothetical protein